MLSPKICSAAVFLSDMAYTNVDIDVLFLWLDNSFRKVFGRISGNSRRVFRKNSQLLSVHCTCIKTQNYLNECSLFFGISVILSLLFVMIFFFQGMSVIFQVALGLLKVKHPRCLMFVRWFTILEYLSFRCKFVRLSSNMNCLFVTRLDCFVLLVIEPYTEILFSFSTGVSQRAHPNGFWRNSEVFQSVHAKKVLRRRRI